MTHYFQLNFNCRPIHSYLTIINFTTWLISNLVLLETTRTSHVCSLLIQCDFLMTFIDNFDIPIHSI